MAASKPQSSKEEIHASIGVVLDDFEVYHNNILVATWIRPAVTEGGIHLPNKTQEEDKWQGKVGLVMAFGPQAFYTDSTHDFGDQEISIGDWIIYRVSDGFPVTINGVHCRLLQDVEIKGRIKDPKIIY